MNNEQLYLWKKTSRFSIHEAALLLSMLDPSIYGQLAEHDLAWDKSKLSKYRTFKSLISSALQNNEIQGELVYETRSNFDTGETLPTTTIDTNNSIVHTNSIESWCLAERIPTKFFDIPWTDNAPYLDKSHPNYSPKLAAAVHAWTYLVNEGNANRDQRHPKQKAIKWLTDNYKELGLISPKTGKVNSTAITQQIAVVVNWEDKGGAPRS